MCQSNLKTGMLWLMYKYLADNCTVNMYYKPYVISSDDTDINCELSFAYLNSTLVINGLNDDLWMVRILFNNREDEYTEKHVLIGCTYSLES